MPVRMHHINREFSPSEAAAITGVSVDQQRDWRRHKFLPENTSGKWTRFNLEHLIKMLVMKAFTESGFSVSDTIILARLAVLPTLALLNLYPGAVVFEGDQITDDLKARALLGSVRRTGASSATADEIENRYLVMYRDDSGEVTGFRCNGLTEIDYFLGNSEEVFHVTVLDCLRLVNTIVKRAGLPLSRIEVEKIKGSE